MSAWTVIAHQELSSNILEINFDNIPQDGTDLLCMISVRPEDAAEAIFIYRLNDSTSGYTGRDLRGSGSSSFSTSNLTTLTQATGAWGRLTTTDIQSSAWTANTFSNTQLYIPNYTSSVAKSISFDTVAENNATTTNMAVSAHAWSGTDAITKLSFSIHQNENSATYSSFTLYKITKGSSGGVTVS